MDFLDCPSKREEFLSGQLTIKQIETLAKKTHLPFGYFFLNVPPQQNIRSTIPDLRQLPSPMPLSVDFFDTLDDVLRKQQWYLDYLKELNTEKLTFVGKFKFEQNVSAEVIASDIRETLNLTIQEQKKCANFEEFFNLLSEKAEAIGILVFRNGIVKNNTRRPLSVDEFRGFAIADSYAPVIFINGKDSEAAWMFTFAHELAHIWLGESGISDNPNKQELVEQKLEKYCNQIAAELLVPKALFLVAWESVPEPKIEALGREFKVSQLVIVKRAYDFGKITWNEYITKVNESKRIKASDKGTGGNFYRTIPIRNSKRVTRAILNSAMSGNMMLREAASLLNTQPDTVIKIDRK